MGRTGGGTPMPHAIPVEIGFGVCGVVVFIFFLLLFYGSV